MTRNSSNSNNQSSNLTDQVDTREMTTAEAGALGGKRTAQLIEEGKLYEQEHANDRGSRSAADRSAKR